MPIRMTLSKAVEAAAADVQLILPSAGRLSKWRHFLLLIRLRFKPRPVLFSYNSYAKRLRCNMYYIHPAYMYSIRRRGTHVGRTVKIAIAEKYMYRVSRQ